MAFFSEAWTVTFTTPEQAHRAARQRDNHPLDTHPRRVEQRLLVAVERNGVRFVVSQNRGSSSDTAISRPGVPSPGHAGLLPNALDTLNTATLDVHLPPTTRI